MDIFLYVANHRDVSKIGYISSPYQQDQWRYWIGDLVSPPWTPCVKEGRTHPVNGHIAAVVYCSNILTNLTLRLWKYCA